MGQDSVVAFLKGNAGLHFYAGQIAEAMGVGLRSVQESLRALEGDGSVVVRCVKGDKNAAKLYAWNYVDDGFGEALKNLELVKRQNPYLNSELVCQLLILKELKRVVLLLGRLKDGDESG